MKEVHAFCQEILWDVNPSRLVKIVSKSIKMIHNVHTKPSRMLQLSYNRVHIDRIISWPSTEQYLSFQFAIFANRNYGNEDKELELNPAIVTAHWKCQVWVCSLQMLHYIPFSWTGSHSRIKKNKSVRPKGPNTYFSVHSILNSLYSLPVFYHFQCHIPVTSAETTSLCTLSDPGRNAMHLYLIYFF